MRGGHNFSAETRAKLSALFKGKKRSKETREKISRARRGKTISPEQRAKISAALRGRKLSPQECFERRVSARVIKLFKPEIYEAKKAYGREFAKRMHADPAWRAAFAAAQKARWERYRAAKAQTDCPKDRWARVAALRADGMTLKAIGAELGISIPRVWQILKKLSRIPSPVEGLGK